MAHNVIAEAKRCLNCKKPLCRTGCPINTPIPDMISMFLNGDINKAGKMVFENNPLSVVCSIVCNHGNQCQGHCVRGLKGEPVEISTIENFISSRYLDTLELEKAEPNGIKVAVVGAGPAGIVISIKMAQLGYDVTVFESKAKIGGVLRFGIPEFRLPKTIVDRYEVLMRRLGIKIKPNITIGKAFGVEELFRDGFKAISIGTGVTWPIALNIKGETLGHVHYGVHYLESPSSYDLGKSMVIIGAGNVAMDVARTALRKGVKDVKIVVRSDKYSASKEEAEYAEIEGAQFVYNKAPVEITDDGVMFADTVCDEEHRVEAYFVGHLRARDQREGACKDKRKRRDFPPRIVCLGRRCARREDSCRGRRNFQARRHSNARISAKTPQGLIEKRKKSSRRSYFGGFGIFKFPRPLKGDFLIYIDIFQLSEPLSLLKSDFIIVFT